jgi:transposase
MERRLRREEVMTIEVLHGRGCAKRAIARTLGVDEKAVRYRLERQQAGRPDGRAGKARSADAAAEAIAHWMGSHPGEGQNLAALHDWLVSEHGYLGSLRGVQRFVRAHYPRPRLRARRRVETPPGAQAQADWAEFPGVRIRGAAVDLHAFELALSWSRMDAVVWSECEDELAWLAVHNAALRRLEGVPAVIRVDNLKTAIASGAGPWGVVHPAYRAYARAVRFHVDAARPYAPGDKGKVERRIRDRRTRLDPYARVWESLEELQAHTDATLLHLAARRRSPATGLSVHESWEQEKPHLGALPLLPEPFDLVAQRRVGIDATVQFEGRTYSVPFRQVGREIEVRGCTRVVQMLADGGVIAEHPRATRSRIVIDPAHYEGPGTERVIAPVPLGRMGRRLQEIAALVPERRPIDLYAALAGVAR